jgi:hypothetical protein
MKSNALYRQTTNAFDKKELDFCKRVLGTLKDAQLPCSTFDFEVNLDQLTLDHELIETDTAIRDKSKQISDFKRDVELKIKENKVREMWLKHSKEGANPHMAEIILKNKKIFQVENIMLLKKRMEKDPTLGEPLLKRTVNFQHHVNKLSKQSRYEKAEIVCSDNLAQL